MGIIATISLVALTAMHTAVSAVKSTNGQVADAVYAVASDARAAIVYDGTNAQLHTAAGMENRVTVTTIVGPSTLSIVGILAKTNESYQEVIPIAQEAVDPNAGYTAAH